MSWRRDTARAVARLLAAAAPDPATAATVDPSTPAGLPPPVARYLSLALPGRPRRVRTARVAWAGEFQMRPGAGWRRFDAEQHFTSWPPGFVWDARIRALPLVPGRVRDSYIAGEGRMLARVAGVATMVDQGGTRELAAGALARWLGETAWFPSALLPAPGGGGGVRWEAVDDRTARAAVTDGETAVSADFHFARGGELTGMSAMRYRDVDGAAVLTPFEGRYEGYARRGDVMIPTAAEVAWLLPEGRFPYWRGRPAEVAYDDRRPS